MTGGSALAASEEAASLSGPMRADSFPTLRRNRQKRRAVAPLPTDSYWVENLVLKVLSPDFGPGFGYE